MGFITQQRNCINTKIFRIFLYARSYKKKINKFCRAFRSYSVCYTLSSSSVFLCVCSGVIKSILFVCRFSFLNFQSLLVLGSFFHYFFFFFLFPRFVLFCLCQHFLYFQAPHEYMHT